MPRPEFDNPEDFLPSCEVQSTVEILLRGESEPYLYSTSRPLNIDSRDYLAKLLTVSETDEVLGEITNTVSVTLSNIDSGWSQKIADETRPLEFADVVVKRYYQKKGNSSIFAHEHYFTGKLVKSDANQQTANFEVVTPETAAGTCIATETLTPANDWFFEYVTPSAPGSGGNGGGEGSGSCPRVDQFVLGQGSDDSILPIRAEKVVEKFLTNKNGVKLWHPILKIFCGVLHAEIVENQPIWEVRNTLGAVGFGSPTHPLIRTLGDGKGEALQALSPGNVTLVWLSSGEVKRDRLTVVRDTETLGSVVRIEMEDGHIYAFGDDVDFMFVCHNAANKNSPVLT